MFRNPDQLKNRPEAAAEEEGPKSLKDFILALAEERGSEKTFTPSDAARAFRPEREDEVKGDEAWRKYLRQVRVEAIGLARQGRIDILRKGQPIDPAKPFKGVYKLRLNAAAPSIEEESDA